MEFQLLSAAGGELQISRNIEDMSAPHKLLNAQTDSVKGNFGSMYFHHLPGTDFSLWSSVYDIKEATTIIGKANFPILEIHGSVENHMQTAWDGIDLSLQREDQYNLSFTPYVNNTVQFYPGKRYRTFDIHPSISLLQTFASFYPALDKFLNKVEKGSACSLTSSDYFITSHMRDCLERISDYSCNPGVANFFYECKVKEFIIMLLDQVSWHQERKQLIQKFTASQIEGTHRVKELIISDLSNPKTISKLAQNVHMNECTLKKCFRHLFGTSIHQYYIKERMKKAKSLLLDPALPIYEICSILGYADKQNFYTDFKKHCKITPGQWCLQNKLNRKELRHLPRPLTKRNSLASPS